MSTRTSEVNYGQSLAPLEVDTKTQLPNLVIGSTVMIRSYVHGFHMREHESFDVVRIDKKKRVRAGFFIYSVTMMGTYSLVQGYSRPTHEGKLLFVSAMNVTLTVKDADIMFAAVDKHGNGHPIEVHLSEIVEYWREQPYTNKSFMFFELPLM